MLGALCAARKGIYCTAAGLDRRGRGPVAPVLALNLIRRYPRGLYVRHPPANASGRGAYQPSGRPFVQLEVVKMLRHSERATAVTRPCGLDSNRRLLSWIHTVAVTWQARRPADSDRAVRRLAAELRAVAVSVQYRQACEHPYPAALDDCYAALQWLIARDDIDRRRIPVAGKSAGAGLAAALVLRCVDGGLAESAGRFSLTQCSTTALFSGQPLLPLEDGRQATIRSAGARTLGCEPGADGVSAYAAPARREDFSGLPPTWIGVGAGDLFHDGRCRIRSAASRRRSANTLGSSSWRLPRIRCHWRTHLDGTTVQRESTCRDASIHHFVKLRGSMNHFHHKGSDIAD